jgi:hypothetical protein
MVTTITDVLNAWNSMGVFSYVLPFLLIFAVVYAIIDKTKMFYRQGSENKGIVAIIAVAIALLSLQFDFVSNFFAIIFPRFGIGLSLFLVVLIFLGFFYPEGTKAGWSGKVAWIGWVVGIGVFLWALSSWDQWNHYAGFGGWFSENVWALIVLGILVAIIAVTARSGREVAARSGTTEQK